MSQSCCCQWRMSLKNATETGRSSFSHAFSCVDFLSFCLYMQMNSVIFPAWFLWSVCCVGFFSYESMKCLCDRYNRAIDSIRQLVSLVFDFFFSRLAACDMCALGTELCVRDFMWYWLYQLVCYQDGGGGHWLVWMEWRPAGWSVCLPLLIFPCTMKSRSFSSGTGSPGLCRKRAVKWLCVCCGGVVCYQDVSLQVFKHGINCCSICMNSVKVMAVVCLKRVNGINIIFTLASVNSLSTQFCKSVIGFIRSVTFVWAVINIKTLVYPSLYSNQPTNEDPSECTNCKTLQKFYTLPKVYICNKL